MAQSHGSLNNLDHHISLLDDKKLRLCTGFDAFLTYDGTNLVVQPQLVGSGNMSLAAGGIELIDSASLILGTGEDATIKYNGTDLQINPQVVGSGNVSITAGSLELK